MLALNPEATPSANESGPDRERLAELEKRLIKIEQENTLLKSQMALANDELDALTENLLDIVFFLDGKGNLCRIAGNVIGILGTVPQIHRPVSPEQWLAYFAIDDRAVLKQAIADLPAFHKNNQPLRVRVRDQADEYRWLEISLHRTDATASTPLYSGVARDITENHQYAQLMDTLNKAASRIRQPGLSQEGVLHIVTDELRAIEMNSVVAFIKPEGLFQVEAFSMSTSYVTAVQSLLGQISRTVNLSQLRPIQDAIRTRKAQYFEVTIDVVRAILNPEKRRWAGALSGMLTEKHAICAPMVTGDIVHGILCVLSNHLNSRSAPAIAAFANQTAIALENAELISQLADSEQRYRRIFEAVTEGLVLIDSRGRISSANHAACLLFGYGQNELIRLDALDFFDEKAVAAISQALDQPMPEPFKVQSRIIQRIGKTLEVEIDGTLFFVQDRPGLLLTIRDITERIESEKALMHSEKLRALGQMAGGVAHDFNNLLHVIQGFTSLATSELTEDPQSALADLERVLKASDDAAEAVRRLQSLYRKADDQSDFGPIDLTEIISDAIDLNSPRWKDEYQQQGKTIHISTEIGEIPPMRGNGSELRRVFGNLIINAIDAMPEGGSILVKAEAKDDQCFVIFADTGCGMTKEQLEHVFEPFYTTKGLAGSGLGLTMSKRIIERHGGKIAVDGNPGQGTTFTITLPTDASRSALPSVLIEPDMAVTTSQLRVLVVDDDPSIRTIMTRFLLTRGHHVVHAGDGRQALETLAKETFDLVITDLGMPDVSGRRVVQVARELQPGIPIILSTGWGDSITPAQLKELGANALLSKPFSISDLSVALKRALPGD